MSRHRFVRNINIHEELDDTHYDEEDPFDGITPEQQAQLDSATDAVTNLLGPEKDSLISVAEIRHTLWDNYFDVDETLEWAFEEQKRRKAAKEKKDQEDVPSAEPPLSPPTSQAPEPKKPLSALAKLAATKSSSTKPSLSALASKSAISPTAPSTAVKPSLASLAALRSSSSSSSKLKSGAPGPVTSDASSATATSTPTQPPTASKLSLLAQANARKSAGSNPSTLLRPKEAEQPALLPSPATSSRQPSKLMQKVQKAREAAQAKTVEPDKPSQGNEGADNSLVESRTESVAEEPDFDPLFPVLPSSALNGLASLSLGESGSHSLNHSTYLVSSTPLVALSAGPSAFASLLVALDEDKTMSGSMRATRAIPIKGIPFGFDTPSPDDLVMSKREGTRLAAGIKASGVARVSVGKAAVSALPPASRSKLSSGTKKSGGSGMKQ